LEKFVKHVEQIVGLKTWFENNFRTQSFLFEHTHTISKHNFLFEEIFSFFEHNFRTQFLHPSRFFLHCYSNFFFWKIRIKILISKNLHHHIWLESSLELPWFEGMKQCWSGTHRPALDISTGSIYPCKLGIFIYLFIYLFLNFRRGGGSWGVGFLLLPMCSYEVLTMSQSSSQWVPNIFPIVPHFVPYPLP
jgi:hypothetical protein